MMSILDLPRNKGASALVLKATSAPHATRAASGLTPAFLQSSIHDLLLLEKDMADVGNFQRECRFIFQYAINIARRSVRQLPVLKCVHLDNLKKEAFGHNSKPMEAHTLHKPRSKGHQNWLEKPGAQVVVFPAIKGYGNSDGDDYDASKVWGKATVWLYKRCIA